MPMRYIPLIIVLLISGAAQGQAYTRLALKGGGIRGIAYAGALQVLEERHVAEGIRQVAGTSVGAITGALFSVGYSSKEIREILFAQDIGEFNDGEGFFYWRAEAAAEEIWLVQGEEDGTMDRNTGSSEDR